MSRFFVKFFTPLLKSFNSLESNNSEINRIVGLYTIGFSTAVLLGHCSYALGTVENKIIQINKKYLFDRNGFTEFMIVDDNGKHYNVNNSLWYWKWDSIEDWHKLEPNKEIIIKCYGWRIPLFGLFPNIVMSDKATVLNSMASAEYRVLEYNRNQEKQNKELTNDEKRRHKISI